jgi:hypothetical protein
VSVSIAFAILDCSVMTIVLWSGLITYVSSVPDEIDPEKILPVVSVKYQFPTSSLPKEGEITSEPHKLTEQYLSSTVVTTPMGGGLISTIFKDDTLQ